MSAVGETRFPDICPECREMIREIGPRKRRRKVCGCPEPEPEPKPAFGGVSLKAKPKTATTGRKGEKNTARLMTGAGLEARLTAGSGATASRSCEKSFDTDLIVRLGEARWRVESKLLGRVPGLKSMTDLLAGSDMLRVQQGAEPGFWLLPDHIMAELGGLAAEALEDR